MLIRPGDLLDFLLDKAMFGRAKVAVVRDQEGRAAVGDKARMGRQL